MSADISGGPVGAGGRLLLRRCALGLSAVEIGLGVAVLLTLFPDLEGIGCHPQSPLGVWACNVPALRREEECALAVAVLMLVSAAWWPARWHVSAVAGGLVPAIDGSYLAAVSWPALLFAAAGFGAVLAAAADYWWLRTEREREAERLLREQLARRRFRHGRLPPGAGRLP